MKLNCETIRDLLPGYADELISANTRTAVDAHLQNCGDCRSYLANLRSSELNIVATVDGRKASLKKRIHRKLWTPVVTALLLLLTVLCGVMIYATVPVWLTCEEAVVAVKDGTEMTSIVVTPQAMEKLTISAEAENGKKATGIVFYGYRNHLIYPERKNEVAFLRGSMEGVSLWYRGDCLGKPDVLLLGDGEATLAPVIARQREAGWDLLNNHNLCYVVILAALAGIVLLILWILFRKKKLGSVFSSFCLLCVCCIAACLFVTDGQLISLTNMTFGAWGCLRRYVAVAVMTLLSWGTVTLGVKTYRLYK